MPQPPISNTDLIQPRQLSTADSRCVVPVEVTTKIQRGQPNPEAAVHHHPGPAWHNIQRGVYAPPAVDWTPLGQDQRL